MRLSLKLRGNKGEEAKKSKHVTTIMDDIKTKTDSSDVPILICLTFKDKLNMGCYTIWIDILVS
jgi:hypothetical protein